MTFVHLAPFVRHWHRLRLRDEDLQALERQLIRDPLGGDLMRGTGGLRKLRFAPPSWGRGKRGATRVGYAWFPVGSTMYLITLFAKNEKANLSAAERNTVRDLLRRIAAAHRAEE